MTTVETDFYCEECGVELYEDDEDFLCDGCREWLFGEDYLQDET